MVEAIVTFDYDKVQDDELTLKKGQTITNISMMEEGWWEGEVNGQRGLFPDNFVELIKDKPSSVKGKAPSPPPAAHAPASAAAPEAVNGDSQDVPRREGSEKTKKLRAKVVYSYHPQNEDEISLIVDEIIDVIGQPEDGWWEGVVKGTKGMFPSNFVTVIEEGVGSANKMAGAGTEDGPPPIPAEPPRSRPPKIKGVGFGNIFAAGEVKLRKATDHPKKGSSHSAGQSELAQKRLSLKRPEAVPTPKPDNNAEVKAKDEPKKEIKPEVKREEKKDVKVEEEDEFEEIVKERARATFQYQAQHPDELELKEGDIVTVLNKEAGDSGWWLGEIDGREGVFPDNFVTMLPPEKEKVKKRSPAAAPARPVSGPKTLSSETKPTTSKPMLSKPPPPPDGSAPPSSQPRRPSANQNAVGNALPKEEPPPRKPHPIAAPKPVLPIPLKKPAIRAKALPPKPAAPPPEREEAPPPVILRKRQSVDDTKEAKEGGFEDLKSESGPKLTHITRSRPKHENRRPPSVFGGQSINLSEARDEILQHDKNADSPDGRIPTLTAVVTSPTAVVTLPTSPTNSSQPPWVRELKARSIKRPFPLAKEPQLPVENGTAVPPPRPKSSPIGPTLAAASLSQAVMAGKRHTETSPAQSPNTSRPTSLTSDTAGQASNAQVEELKKEIKSLQDQMASIRSEFKKDVMNLMTELDEEKKHRMAMQVELDRIKKLVLETK